MFAWYSHSLYFKGCGGTHELIRPHLYRFQLKCTLLTESTINQRQPERAHCCGPSQSRERPCSFVRVCTRARKGLKQQKHTDSTRKSQSVYIYMHVKTVEDYRGRVLPSLLQTLQRFTDGNQLVKMHVFPSSLKLQSWDVWSWTMVPLLQVDEWQAEIRESGSHLSPGMDNPFHYRRRVWAIPVANNEACRILLSRSRVEPREETAEFCGYLQTATAEKLKLFCSSQTAVTEKLWIYLFFFKLTWDLFPCLMF